MAHYAAVGALVGVSITELLAEKVLALAQVAGRDGLDRQIVNHRIQKPGLALTGYEQQLDRGRLLTLGGTEIEFLAGASETARRLATTTVMSSEPACIVVTRGLEVPAELASACDDAGVPLLVTPLVSADFIYKVKSFLSARLSPATSLHGVLVEVHGLGILILGRSGIGKSEAAIDLVLRGHPLVADDVVMIRREGPSAVLGYGAELIEHHMEIRGLGIIDVKALFGVGAVRASTRIRLVIELVEVSEAGEIDRLGLDEEFYSVLGEELPYRKVPVSPGRNAATIIEVAARNLLLKQMGQNTAAELVARLERAREAASAAEDAQ